MFNILSNTHDLPRTSKLLLDSLERRDRARLVSLPKQIEREEARQVLQGP